MMSEWQNFKPEDKNKRAKIAHLESYCRFLWDKVGRITEVNKKMFLSRKRILTDFF